MIPRVYTNLESFLRQNKVLVLYGPRRVGKTTLLGELLSQTKLKYKLDSGDNLSVQELLSSQKFDQMLPYLQGYELYALDEAQHVPNIGMALKILVDQLPGIKIIVTCSSSLDLRGQIGEPLVGRKRELTLFPIAQSELLQQHNEYELRHLLLPEMLIYGSYPEVVSENSSKSKQELIEQIINSYLLKDILEFERVKDSKTVRDLLKLVAFQVGTEVSLTELGSQLSLDKKTVSRYLDLLEKSFILYNLRGYSRNLRKEITTKSKYYFLDTGIRNALINNYNSLDQRNDIGQLWENFLVSERLKAQSYKQIHANNYFWRTWDQKEVDWVEERDGKLFGFEFKWSEKKRSKTKEFLQTYPEANLTTINPENYLDFVL